MTTDKVPSPTLQVQTAEDFIEVLGALEDLSFECYSPFAARGDLAQAPSAKTYNRTFAILDKHRKALGISSVKSSGASVITRERQRPQPQQMVTRAISDVLAERERQVSQEGWTPEHDDEHDMGELALAAACYAHSGAGGSPDLKRSSYPEDFGIKTYPNGRFEDGDIPWVPRWWPSSWAAKWWKPKNPRRDLVRAAALILAEIDRLDRLTPTPSSRISGPPTTTPSDAEGNKR